MIKKNKIVLLIVLVLGVLFVGVGIFLGFGGKSKNNNTLKEFELSGKYLVRIRNNLILGDGKKYTYYDLNGKKVLDLESENEIYDSRVLELMDVKDGLFVSTKDGVTYGVIDSAKTEVLANKYYSVVIASKNCFIVQNEDNSYSIVNAKGEDLLGVNYDYYYNYDGAGVALMLGDKWSLIDQNGNLISKANYSYIADYSFEGSESTVLVGQYGNDTNDIFIFKNGALNVIEKVGNSVFANKDYVYYAVSDGTFSSYSLANGKIEKNAEVDFSENGMITTISDAGLLGFKSTDGKTVIEEKYQVEGTSNFTKYGLAIVSLNNLKGIIDKTGKEIIPCKYKSIYIFSDKVFAISEDNNQTYYLIDNNDKKIYDSVSYDGVSDFVVAYNGDKCGIVDKNGKNVTELNNVNCQVYYDMYFVKSSDSNWVVGRK